MQNQTKMTRAPRFAAVVGVLLVVGAGLTGCSQAASSTTSKAPIQVAASMPLTGDSAAYGIGTENGMDLAVSQINKAGGIDGRQLKVTKYDDQCDPSAAATAANDIISNKAYVAVIGNVCSSATLAQMPIFERVKLPIIDPSASSPALTQKPYAGFTRIVPNDTVQGEATIKLAIKVLGKKKIAVLYPSDDYGQALYAVAKNAIKQFGGTLVSAQTYVTGSTNNFSSQLSNIAAAKPDALFLAGYYADMGAAVNQSVRAFNGQKITLVAAAQDQQPQYVSLAGAAGNGTYVTNVYDPSNPSAVNKKFVSTFKAMFHKEPGLQEALGYDNVYVLKAALEKTHDSETGLAAAARAVVYDGVIGKISFNKVGDNIGGGLIALQLEDGTWKFSTDLTAKLNKK